MIRAKIKPILLKISLLFLVGNGNDLEAGIPVFDYSHIAVAIGNTAKQIKEWQDYIQQFRQYSALMLGTYQGIHSWEGLEWIDSLSLLELPFFDGIDGIEELRDVAAASTMTVQDLAKLYEEIELITRLASDKRYANMVGYQARMSLFRAHSNRVMRIRMLKTRAFQMHQVALNRLLNQQKIIHNLIKEANASNPVPIAKVESLKTKLNLIQTQIDTLNSIFNAKMKAIDIKIEHNEAEHNAKMLINSSSELDVEKRKQYTEEQLRLLLQK